jgi:iron complex outermembrane recepter protein
MQRSRTRKVRREIHSAPRTRTLLRRAPIAAAIVVALQSAHAQEAGSSANGGLEEVVVTASKRTENLQNVPISVEALDTRKLEDMNLQHFNDYAQALPEVSYQTLQPGFSRTFMRGVGSDNNPNHSGPLPSVGTYLDEQPITTIQGPLDVHVYDIARVEVLPGPQGTLYGASSEAGTIRIITNKPDATAFKAGYDLQGNTIQNGTAGGIAEGFVNIPLSANAAVRLVGWYERDSGYIDNVPGTLTYPATNFTLNNAAIAEKHYNPTTTYGGRAALKLDLNDSWTVTPQLMAQKTTWDGIFGQEIWKDLADGSPVPSDLAVKHFYPEGGYDDWLDAALTVQGKIGNFELTYAGAYLRRTDHTSSDYTDYSVGYEQYASYWPSNPSQQIFGDDRYQMFSNELRITSPKDYPVRFVAGVFQQRQTHGIQQDYVIDGLNPNYWIGVGTPYLWTDTWWLTEQQRVNRDNAVFGELNWDLTHSLTLTGGIRHFTYKNTLEGFYGFSANTFTPTEGQATCFISTSFHGAPCEDLDKRADGSGWTPKLNASYKFDADHLVYLTWSKGFRPGGVNRVGSALPYGADFLKNYEAGWKTQWLDNHLRFNGAVYYEQWDNFQFSFLGPNSVTIVANAGAARIKGAESELEWAATSAFTLSAGAAYTDAYLSENYCGELNPDGSPVTANPCPDLSHPGQFFAPQAPTGTQLPLTPRFKGNLNARYNFPVMSWEGHVQLAYVYQSAIWPDLRIVDRTLLGQQAAFGLTNLFFGVQKNNLTLELLAKNLFDIRASTYRYTECTQATCGPIAVYNVIAPPRLIGLQVGQRF